MQKDKKLELLAPAGSKEAFLSAIEAGADSIYTGIKEYNARLKADNLNLYDFEVLCNYAKSKNVKVYLAFNTLIKHTEIHNTVKILSRINAVKPDGIIVQDMGLAEIIKIRFPELTLHASTQMAAHNSHGVKVLSDFGFKRVILARELSFSEIKLINNKSNVELEIFCHGALCFCISGMCLFSSFIGGHSGNRGLCTQPCRRIWMTPEKEGYLFSPKDLMLAEYVNKIKKTGIKAIKIEGRMRSSEYVYRTVKAYRMLIDSSDPKENDNIEKEAYELLNRDYARSKTAYLFSGKDLNIIMPDSAQCLGKEIGSVHSYSEDNIFIKTNYKLSEGDRIRISDPSLDMTRNIKILKYEVQEDIYKITYSGEKFEEGTPVFLAGESSWDEKVFTKELNRIYGSYAKEMLPARRQNVSEDNSYTNLIARQWDKSISNESESLWIKSDNPAWCKILSETCDNVRLAMTLTAENLYKFMAGKKNIESILPSAIELPPYISQRDAANYIKVINEYFSSGIKIWVLNNVSQFEYFKNLNAEIVAGHFLYAWNLYSARAYKDMGAKYFTASWEDDFLNIRRLAVSGIKNQIIVYLYGRPCLVRSKMIENEMFESSKITDKNNLRLNVQFASGEGVIYPEEPFSIFTAKNKLKELGISNFGIDLNFLKPDVKIWKKIYENYEKGVNPESSVKFNFKRGVK